MTQADSAGNRQRCPKCHADAGLLVRGPNEIWHCIACGHGLGLGESHDFEAKRMSAIIHRDVVRPLQRQLLAAETLCQIYLEIAEAAIGQDQVQVRRDAAIAKRNA